jgi:hypothetical protein
MSDLITDRLDRLEAAVLMANDIDTARLSGELEDEARIMALYSIVRDLAERAGVGADDFCRHYENRFRYWHSHYLRKAEDCSQPLAVRLDRRVGDTDAADESYPSIFDPPSASP